MTRPTGHRLAAACVMALSLSAGCGRESGNGNNGGSAPPPVPVSTQVVGRAAIRRTLTLAGSILPESQVQLVSKVAGRIEELGADAGSEVPAGHPVARLDRELPAATLKQAQAGAAVAGAELRAADVALDDARRDWKRAAELFDGGAINEQARDKAKAALDSAEVRRELAASRLAQARAAVTAAEVGLAETEIRSTVSGTVTRRHLDRGDFLSPGQPLLTVQDLRTVKVVVAVTQADLPLLVPGLSRARLKVDGLDEVFEAGVTLIEPVLDRATLSARVELRVPNRRRPGPSPETTGPWMLLAGMSVRVELALAEHSGAVVVPLESVRNDSRRDFVFVVEEAGAAPQKGAVARRVDVRLGIGSDGLIEVLEPADLAGRSVIVGGVTRVTDGSRVQVGSGGPGAPGAAAPAPAR